MALLKYTATLDGVPLEYHRVAYISIDTNISNSIFVNSYISEEERTKELLNLERSERRRLIETGEIKLDEEELRNELQREVEYDPIYIHGSSYTVPYNQYMTIDSAYEYLKTLPEFEGAEDC